MPGYSSRSNAGQRHARPPRRNAKGRRPSSRHETAHAAGLDESLWPDALRALARNFGAVGATLEDFGKQPFGLRYLRTAGLPSQAETDYLDHYQHNNPRAAYAFRNLSQLILTDYVLIDERTMDRDAYYMKYLKSIDLRYFMSGQIMDTADAQAIVSIQRTRQQGHVEKADVERLRRLLPHFNQAYDVSLRLRQSARAVRTFEHALELLADGIAMVRSDGRIVHANEAFLAIARRDDGLRVRKGTVEFAAGASRQRFAAALGAAARWHTGELEAGAPGDFALPRNADGMPYLVSVRALPRDARHHGGAAVAIVFVRDPLASQAGMVRLMREVFGLTDAEAHMADALRTGVPLGDYARAHKVSINTVYTHLRRIKDKTGAKRLPDLIRKLGGLQTSLRSD